MADPATYRPGAGEVPDLPGVYRFRDEHGRVLYVGKAKSLRSRLSNYFQDIANLHLRTAQMVQAANSVEWTVVDTEVEALALEYTWIKEFTPRFNIMYRDDKSYPYLAVTMKDEYPRVLVTRSVHKDGTRYFGPFGHGWAIRETVDLLLRVFPVRTCSNGVFKRARLTGRPCLLGYIDKCAAPCVDRISQAEHRKLIEDFVSFMAGNTGRFERELTAAMQAAAQLQDYETAARYRDNLSALRQAMEKNAVVFADDTDADVFAMAGDELEAAVQVFHVRSGRIRGQRGWVVEKMADSSAEYLIEQLLQQVYGDSVPEAVPSLILVPTLPPNVKYIEAWLQSVRGKSVKVRVAHRGPKKDLALIVSRNAEQAFNLHRSRRAGDLTTRSQALAELQAALGMPIPALRIECFDISTTGGTFQVGSMVVFEDGLPRKGDYRSFNIRGEDGEGARDDTAAIAEVMRRRFSDARSSDSAFGYQPGLVVVDGGEPQVNAAAKALAEIGVDVTVIGLAKRLEEVWRPGEAFPTILERGSQGLYLLQRVRDEAHRFAITRHRARRGKAMTISKLDGVPGLGPSRQQALLRKFKSVKRLRAASAEQLQTVAGIGPQLAQAILAALGPQDNDTVADQKNQ